MQTSNADIQKAVQTHRLLLKTLSRSGTVDLVDAVPVDGCVNVMVGSDTTLHVDVTVSAVVIDDNGDDDQQARVK